MKIKIGYLDSHTKCPASKAALRTMKIVKDSLIEEGYELVPFVITNEELYKLQSLAIGLIANSCLGPLMQILEDNYEYPLHIYRL